MDNIRKTGIATGQMSLYSDKRGTFGPTGSIRGNACGAFAVQNALTLLGEKPSFEKVLEYFNRHWIRTMFLGGCMGSNPRYVDKLIRKHAKCGKNTCCLKITSENLIVRWISHLLAKYVSREYHVCKGDEFEVEKHPVYVVLYSWSVWDSIKNRQVHGVHFQALSRQKDERLTAYNGPDGTYRSFQEFYQAADVRAMLVIGYDIVR